MPSQWDPERVQPTTTDIFPAKEDVTPRNTVREAMYFCRFRGSITCGGTQRARLHHLNSAFDFACIFCFRESPTRGCVRPHPHTYVVRCALALSISWFRSGIDCQLRRRRPSRFLLNSGNHPAITACCRSLSFVFPRLRVAVACIGSPALATNRTLCLPSLPM